MTVVPAPGSLREMLAPFQRPVLRRSVMEIAITSLPLLALWGLGALAVAQGLWWLGLLSAVPAAGFVVRIFMIQHDCGHRAFFRTRWINDWVGRTIGVITLTPHDCWRRTHNIHHATSGNLDRRELGAVKTASVEEYRAMTPMQRLGYRAYRNPVTLFIIGPFYVFFMQQRLPHGIMKEGWRPWVSAMGTNAAIAAACVFLVSAGRLDFIVLVWAPTLMLASSSGIWLFFVQHQFEETYWRRENDWRPTEAALLGSSYYVLPAILRWLTANIGIHHVHHASPRIPYYHLNKVLQQNPSLCEISRLSLVESIRCAGLSLWDAASQQLISFEQFARLYPANGART